MADKIEWEYCSNLIDKDKQIFSNCVDACKEKGCSSDRCFVSYDPNVKDDDEKIIINTGEGIKCDAVVPGANKALNIVGDFIKNL